MSSTGVAGGKGSDKSPPALPPNVSIFSPADPNTTNTLLNGRLFTRLSVSRQTEPSHLLASLKNPARPELNGSFHLCHRNHILIFDGDDNQPGNENEDGSVDLQDVHHEHFRLVCLALKDGDIGLDFAACVFDTPDILQAGFQVDKLAGGAVLVIDLVEDQADDSSDDDSDPEEVSVPRT